MPEQQAEGSCWANRPSTSRWAPAALQQWNSCFCEDCELARKSRHALLADCVEQGALLMPAHFAPPHAAYVQARGDRFALDWDWDNARGR